MSPVRFTLSVSLLAAAALPSGCRHEVRPEAPPHVDYRSYLSDPSEPKDSVPESHGPPSNPAFPAEVTTVLSPDCPPRPISLAECIALALENGRTGEFYDRGRGPTGPGVSVPGPRAGTDSIRVFAYDPAILATQIAVSLSKFDAVYQSGFVFNHFDRPSGLDLSGLTGLIPVGSGTLSAAQGIGVGTPAGSAPAAGSGLAGGQDILSGTTPVLPGALGLFNNLGRFNAAQYRSELLKPLPTGGVAGITFRTDYVSANFPFNIPFIGTNPIYRPAVDVSFEQPLLQGAGVFINQLREAHPGGVRTPVRVGGRVPGILLTRITHEQAKLEFERHVNDLLYVVEEAYWDLYSAYYDLYSRGEAMKQALAAWQVAKKRYDEGVLDVADLAQIEEQYQVFRAERLEALGRGVRRPGGVLEAERRLRYVLGLPPEDGTRLVPRDVPTDTPFAPDWQTTAGEAIARRPEVVQIQREIEAAELRLRRAKDLLLPDLRFFARYNVNGAGGTFGDGVRDLAENRFHDYELGLLLQVPIGFREGHAEVRRAQLQLAQRTALLRDQQSRVILALQRSHRDVVQFREEIRVRRSRREAAAVQLKRRTEKFEQGRETIDFLLQAQRNWSDALRDEYVAVCNYNVALADYERQKGTIMGYRNVALAEGPLPDCAQPRASEFIRRTLAPRPDGDEARAEGDHATGPAGGPPGQLPQPATAPLPHLLQEQKALPDKLGTAPTGRDRSP